MKIQLTTPADPHPGSLSCTLRAAHAAVALLALLTAMPAAAQEPAGAEPCIVTARYVREAEEHEARSRYNIALANANNEPTAQERNQAADQAKVRYQNSLTLTERRFAARKELCHQLGEERYNPQIDPSNFLTPQEAENDPNPLFPLVRGKIYNFRADTEDGKETIKFRVTHRTRRILGVTCTVIHDSAYLEGELVEDTDDWFAQDKDGNVWYFGESTAEYEDGLIVSVDGAWEAGVRGARPGIIMLANPKVGKTYRQELFLGEAEDAGEILALDKEVKVPAGNFAHCLKTRDFSPIEPSHVEHKFYAPGVGTVLEVDVRTGTRTELVSIETE